MAKEWVEIDGSRGEGGGQMLRTSLALSILTGRPMRMKRIRANRPKRGLQAQHLASVRAAAAICLAGLEGAELRSESLTFHPGQAVAGTYEFPIATAGATTLVLQTVSLPLILQGKEVSSVAVTGGTHALHAPSGEFIRTTWAAYLRRLGLEVQVEVARPGYFPRGGGRLQAVLHPAREVAALSLLEPLDTAVHDWEFVAAIGGGLPRSIGERMFAQVQSRLGPLSPVHGGEARGGGRIEEHPRTLSPGVVATLVDRRGPAPTVFFALGARGKPAERVADEAVEQYLAHHRTGAPVDGHSADQLILPLAFASGGSAFQTSMVTEHLRTNLDVVSCFVERKMTCEGPIGQPGWVRIG